MRTVYVATLFLLIFNSILVLFSIFFTTAVPTSAINVTANATAQGYMLTSNINFYDGANLSILGLSVGAVAIGLLASWATKSTIPIGIAAFGVVVGIFHTFTIVIYNLDPTHNYLIVSILYLLEICLGILVGYDVVEMLTQQRGAT